jgi:hypothetical protein
MARHRPAMTKEPSVVAKNKAKKQEQNMCVVGVGTTKLNTTALETEQT